MSQSTISTFQLFETFPDEAAGYKHLEDRVRPTGRAVLQRGLHGDYHQAVPKHIGRYFDEFTFRFNDGNVKRYTIERIASLVDGADDRWITCLEFTE